VGLHVYPQPVGNGMELSVSGHTLGSAYRLLTSDGRTVRTGNLSGTPSTISTQGLDAGAYILQVDRALPMRIVVVR
jgi:hypothetical protein